MVRIYSKFLGDINILEITESEIKKINKFKGNNFEAWTTCFNYNNYNIIYTGK
jgi:hypothetical protein